MKILITESQLKYLVMNEQLLPSVKGLQFTGYQTQAEGDAFRAWVHQNYPDIAVKNNLSKPPSPYYQSKEIINVYNTPDPNNKNQTLGKTHMLLDSKQRQQQYYKKLEQEKQTIKVTDYCGVTKEYNYKTWYYDITPEYPSGKNYPNPRLDLKSYTIGGSTSPYTAKFNGDWSYLIANFKSKTKEQQEAAIKSKKYLCSGSYKEQPNLIGLLPDAMKSLMTLEAAEITVDIIQTVLQVMPPPGIVIAKSIGLCKAIYYAIRAGIHYYSNQLFDAVIKGFECIAEIVQVATAKVPGGASRLPTAAKKAVELVDSKTFLQVLLQLKSGGEFLVDAFKAEDRFYKALILVIVDVLIPKGNDYLLNLVSTSNEYFNKLDTQYLSTFPWLASGVTFIKTIINLISKYLGLIQKAFSALD